MPKSITNYWNYRRKFNMKKALLHINYKNWISAFSFGTLWFSYPIFSYKINCILNFNYLEN
jgi:hypothetical protein